MTLPRFLLLIAGALIVLVAGMMSATLLDWRPGAWIAFGVVVLFVVARVGGWVGLLPDSWDLGGD